MRELKGPKIVGESLRKGQLDNLSYELLLKLTICLMFIGVQVGVCLGVVKSMLAMLVCAKVLKHMRGKN